MGRPRFLLVTGYRIGTESPVGSLGFGAFEDVPSTDGSWVGWRLVGANNRELARSAGVWATTGGCLTSIAMLRERLDEVTALVAMDHTRGKWSWRLDLADGHRVAVGSRGYQRRREAQYALDQFLRAIRDADTGFEDLIRPQLPPRPALRLVPPRAGTGNAPGAVVS